MKKKVLNFLWLIPLVVGIVIGFIGIAQVKKANEMYVPEMNEPGWFEASSKQSKAEVSGIMMIAGGFGFLSVFGSIATFGIVKTVTSKPFESAREIKKSLDELDDAENNEDQNADILEKLSNISKKKEEPLFCEYCGAMLRKDTTSCDACGARYKK